MTLNTLFKTLINSTNTEEQVQALSEIRKNISKIKSTTISLHRAQVKSVKKLRQANNEYVYDIGMKNEKKPWLFGNNILLHNSVYFSAWPILKHDIQKGLIPWNKDTVVQLYDQISDEVNATFPKFMLDDFHVPKSRGEVIKAGREIVAIKGLFITKKRYAVLYFDKDGKRQDQDGKPGKIKAMGLDLKRSDTPEFMQNFLSEILEKVLNGAEEPEILEMICNFRTEFKARPGWEKGSPKRANKITDYQAKEKKQGKANMPGHVRASINWNTLKTMHGDKYSQQIVDGMKVIVCKIKDNPLGFTSVAYPVDELRLPKWFQDLPFNHSEMETTIINNKLDNLIGVLEWDLESTTQNNTFSTLFSFE
jgi:hypothetical protein